MSDQSPIDLAHLARYTGGDRQLNADVFRLFLEHCAKACSTLRTSLDAAHSKAWREAAHGLKGAALGIGAFELADAAGAAEDMDPASAPPHAAAILRTLNERAEVVLAFIDAYLAG